MGQSGERDESTPAENTIRGEILVESCPSRPILEHISSRWGVLAIVALARGVNRFSELQQKVGGSERVLVQVLQRLEADGLILRVGVAPDTEYSLTPLGKELAPNVEALAEWVEANLQRILIAQHQYAQQRPKKGAGEALSPADGGAAADGDW
jgi:DNA-binding HxlR family transcriptional regulator